jgi:hypothetical protein
MTAPVKTFGQRMPAKPQDPLANYWRIKVSDALYGPYTGYQLCRYHAEGRLAAHSMVAREGQGLSASETQWHAASTDGILGVLFRANPPAVKLAPQFGQRIENAGNKFVLIIDLKSRPSSELEGAILSLGRAHRVAPNVWLFSGAYTMTALRNHLSQFLGQGDSMLLVDANCARASGYNIGPENDILVRQVWSDDLAKASEPAKEVDIAPVKDEDAVMEEVKD